MKYCWILWKNKPKMVKIDDDKYFVVEPSDWVVCDYDEDLIISYVEIPDKYKIESCQRKIETKKAFAAFNSETDPVYIIVPRCHGNGGWCGETIQKECTNLAEALKEKPENGTAYWGDDRARICWRKNINDSLYIWNEDDYIWEKR